MQRQLFVHHGLPVTDMKARRICSHGFTSDTLRMLAQLHTHLYCLLLAVGSVVHH